MKLALLLPPKPDDRKWGLARQAGVIHAITKAAPELSGRAAPYNFDALKAIHADFNAAGFRLEGLEGDAFDMGPIKLALPNRDETIDKYRQMIRNMGRLEIRLLCFNFMAAIGWFRTRVDVPYRGGALTSEFDPAAIGDQLVPEEQRIVEEQVWDNLFYFLNAVLPVAEERGVRLALHPDDPPFSPLKGVGRVLTSAAAFDRVLGATPSPNLGVTFCQATFKCMGEDIKAVSERWMKQKKIFFIHMRNVAQEGTHFTETFHDNGPIDMAEMLRHYHEFGFDGPLRPDHAPAMQGETQQTFSGGLSAGYEILGRLFAVGYLKGIAHASGVPLD